MSNINNTLKRSRIDDSINYELTKSSESPSVKKSRKCFSYANRAMAEILYEYMVPYISNYIEFTKLKTVCKDFSEIFQKHSTKLYFPSMIDKNSGLKAIINKSSIEYLEMKFDYFEGSDLNIYEPNLFTQFTNLKSIKLIGINDMSFIEGIFSEIPSLKEIEFSKCLFGEINWSELQNHKNLEKIIFNSCEELHEMDIINIFFGKPKIDLKFINQSASIDDNFTERFKEIQKEIISRIYQNYISMCRFAEIDYKTIPNDLRNNICGYLSKKILAKIKYEQNSNFLSYE